MKKLGFAAFTAILFVSLSTCAGGPARAANAFTGAGGRGIRIAVLVPDAVGLPTEQNYLPSLVQGVLVGDLSRFSAMSVLDRLSLESVLVETESGIYRTDADFGRLGEIIGVDYVLTGNITRTGVGHALQIQVVGTGRDNIGVTRASFSGTPTAAEMSDLTGIRRASMELLTQMGVNLTDNARQELGGADTRQNITAQTALARGITAQRGGREVVALANFTHAQRQDPTLAEAARRANILSRNISSGNIREDVLHEIAWRAEWEAAIQEANEFFAEWVSSPPPFAIVYDANIRQGAIDFASGTVTLSGITLGLYAETAWFDTINSVLDTVARGFNATGRAEAWGIHWPTQLERSTRFANRMEPAPAPPFRMVLYVDWTGWDREEKFFLPWQTPPHGWYRMLRTMNFARIRTRRVGVEIINAQGVIIGRQDVDLQFQYGIRIPLDRRDRVIPNRVVLEPASRRLLARYSHFPSSPVNVDVRGVDPNLITDTLTVRISHINDIHAAQFAEQHNVSIMTRREFSRMRGVWSMSYAQQPGSSFLRSMPMMETGL